MSNVPMSAEVLPKITAVKLHSRQLFHLWMSIAPVDGDDFRCGAIARRKTTSIAATTTNIQNVSSVGRQAHKTPRQKVHGFSDCFGRVADLFEERYDALLRYRN